MDNEDNDKRKQKGKHHFWITRVLLPIAFALTKILGQNIIFSDVGEFARVTQASFLDVEFSCLDATAEIEATSSNTTEGYESIIRQANDAYIIPENSLSQKRRIVRNVVITSLPVPLYFGISWFLTT
ncbi:homeobox-leucine zipper protein ROC8-like isoform X1 [Iris pallida]|uniref:Homeobox-leucine zipper protein ROC8-like isoform X1 n=1 Tax=Iris pallida TaxID=29817 RepID=A0AAX6FZ42_IRIPA|nr:homeobox-leucine zipper protein ROC8-like isoform X1 [Iris pallida]KAJ6846722.1 homeobox-leucine zipper protein ROC8-like isoform X1 [Iris pallida]